MFSVIRYPNLFIFSFKIIMKKFIIKALVFCSPIIALGFEAFMPPSLFTFRPYEALLFNHSEIGMPFYPNQTLQMNSEGDLCYYTNNAVKKNEFWITDKIGYRNNRFIEDPDVLLIGDSFLVGTSITQDSTLTNLLTLKFDNKLKLYNLAQATFSDFKVLYENQIFKTPKLIIYSIGENDLPGQIIINNNEKLHKNTTVSVWIDKATRLYSINYLTSRILNRKSSGVQSEINNKMFFLKGKNQTSNLDSINNVIEVIETYKSFCDSLGINFLFLPLPNKETVYYDEVPLNKQPVYLSELDTGLKKRNISTINSLKVFNLYRQNNNSLVYHLDDTHWNSNGVNIIAEEIVQEITTNPIYGLNEF